MSSESKQFDPKDASTNNIFDEVRIRHLFGRFGVDRSEVDQKSITMQPVDNILLCDPERPEVAFLLYTGDTNLIICRHSDRLDFMKMVQDHWHEATDANKNLKYYCIVHCVGLFYDKFKKMGRADFSKDAENKLPYVEMTEYHQHDQAPPGVAYQKSLLATEFLRKRGEDLPPALHFEPFFFCDLPLAQARSRERKEGIAFISNPVSNAENVTPGKALSAVATTPAAVTNVASIGERAKSAKYTLILGNPARRVV